MTKRKCETSVQRWSDEMSDKLTAFWAEGLSATKIGERLGMSRNAVIGRVHRLKLPGRVTKVQNSSGRPKYGFKPTRNLERNPSAGQLAARSGVSVVFSVKTGVAKLRPGSTIQKPSPLPTAEPIKSGIGLLDLQPHMCRWPFGDPREEGFSFCGAPKTDGCSYCENHRQRAFNGLPKPRKMPERRAA